MTMTMIESTLLTRIGFDQLSWILSTLILFSFLAQLFFTNDQSWCIHPILLGHQADFSRIRKQSEAPIIVNSGSTRGFFPVTPDKSIRTLQDLLLKSEGKLQKTDISSPIPSNLSLRFLISNVRSHLWSLLESSQLNQDETRPQLMILCADPHVKLIFSLASVTLPITTIMAKTYQSGTLPVEVKQIITPYLDNLSLIISEIPHDDIKDSLGSNLPARVLSIKDISNWFDSEQNVLTAPSIAASDLSKARLLMVHNFPKSDDEQSVGARVFQFTPENLLAGITSSLGLFPVNGKLSSADTVALESHGDVSIWGSEISIAVAALYAGADVYFFNSFKHLSECKPTVLVIKAMTAQILAEEIIQLSKLSFFNKLAIGRRLAKVSNGILASSLPETAEWVGPKLRSILTNGSITQSCANLIRAGFGVTLQRMYTHPVSAGPILASQAYDFQVLQRPDSALHCGPPSVNVECKIVNVPEPSLTGNNAWKGDLFVRGPSIAVELRPHDSNSWPVAQPIDPEGFYQVGQMTYVLPNGTFQILSGSNLGDD